MRHPPKGQVWIHVDRLDRDDGKVWAVQHRVWNPKESRLDAVYLEASSVILNAPCYSQFFGAKAQQPKAVLVVEGGRVELRGDVVVVDG